MKKWILRIVVVVAVLAVIAIAAVMFFLNDIVKKGVETEGPAITKVDVKLEAVTVSLFSGSANIKKFFVGNPQGYKTDSAIKVGEVSVRLKPMSVFSDKVIIDSIDVKSPEITFEGGLTDNNLSKIQANVSAFSGDTAGGRETPEKGTKKKIQVGDLSISGATMHVAIPMLLDKPLTVTLPTIHLTNLGTGADGITPVELTDKVLNALMREVIPAVTKAVADAGLDVGKLGKGAEKQAQDAVKKASGKLKGLFGH